MRSARRSGAGADGHLIRLRRRPRRRLDAVQDRRHQLRQAGRTWPWRTGRRAPRRHPRRRRRRDPLGTHWHRRRGQLRRPSRRHRPRRAEPALREAGLGGLVGRDRFDIVQALVDLVAGAGSDLEGQAAREAALDVIDELFADAADYDELAALTLDADGLVRALEAFLAYYIYNRLRQQIDERLTRYAEPARAEQLDGDLRQLIRAQVRIRFRDVDPLVVDWAGAEGRGLIESALRSVYGVLEALEE